MRIIAYIGYKGNQYRKKKKGEAKVSHFLQTKGVKK